VQNNASYTAARPTEFPFLLRKSGASAGNQSPNPSPFLRLKLAQKPTFHQLSLFLYFPIVTTLPYTHIIISAIFARNPRQ
jgi:hypothetical protein